MQMQFHKYTFIEIISEKIRVQKNDIDNKELLYHEIQLNKIGWNDNHRNHG